MHQAHVNTDTHSAYTAHIQNTNLCHEGRAVIEQLPLKLRVSERGRTRKSLKGRVLLGPCLSQCTVQLGPVGAQMRGLQVSVTYGGVQSFYFRGGRGICAERFCCVFPVFLFSDGGSGVWKKREKMFSFFILFLTHESVIRKKNKRHCVKIS